MKGQTKIILTLQARDMSWLLRNMLGIRLGPLLGARVPHGEGGRAAGGMQARVRARHNHMHSQDGPSGVNIAAEGVHLDWK